MAQIELNAEQIKKALEWCTSGGNCSECPMDSLYPYCSREGCMAKQMYSALTLINELTEENERLKAEVADLRDELKCEKETNAHLCSQYMSENHLRYQAEEMLANGMSVVKADTVREMQEKLIKGAFCSACGIDYSHHIIQIAKEMLEGKPRESPQRE